MSEGWVKVHRSILNHWISGDLFTLGLWSLLILKANHQPNKWLYRGHLYELDRGECLISIHDIAAAQKPKISHKPISARLNMFEAEQMIVQKRSHRGTVVTILNYDKYQQFDVSEGNTEVTQKSQTGQTEVKQRSTNKNDKNDKNDSKKHASPNAPAHLRRKDEELKPFPEEDGPVWLTDSEYQEFCNRWSKAETDFLIRAMVRWESQAEKKFRQRKDHALTLINFRNQELGNGKVFFEHPSTGPNYYKRYEVERWASQ